MKTSRCDKINACFPGPCKPWAAAVLTAGFLLFWFSGLCMADAPAPAAQKNQAHSRDQDLLSRNQAHSFQDLIHYQEQAAFIAEQIQQIQNDLDWLMLKVRRMEDFDRFVPQRMHDSIAFKQSKIASLEKLKKRYQDLIPDTPESRGLADNTARNDAIRMTDLFPNSDSPQPMDTPLGSSFRQQLENQMAAAGLDAWLEVVPHTIPVRLETRLPILFSSASAEIPKGYEPFLKNLAGLVKDHDVRIVVDGYADTDPIDTAAYPSNFELGAARAAAVVRALAGYGIKPQVCKIGSTGQYRFDAKKQTEWKNLQRHATIAVFFNSGV
ncbi:MAG: OmpA family protein [Desulfotignum sp.]|nr:OmpA family protein [Desulfotignum sp.]